MKQIVLQSNATRGIELYHIMLQCIMSKQEATDVRREA